MAFKRAVRQRKKAKVGFIGPSGSGKTYSAILFARGIAGKNGTIAFLDSEKGSSTLYSDLTPFDVDFLEPPYSVETYTNGIDEAIANNYDVLVIDTISPVWESLLGEHDKITRRTGNSFTAWARITPMYNEFVQKILESDIHLIMTIRAKTRYDISTGQNGKMVPRKIGIGPQFRAGIEYEPDLTFDMMSDGKDVVATVTKTRMSIFPIGEEFTPTIQHGEMLVDWLNSGKEYMPSQMIGNVHAEPPTVPEEVKESIFDKQDVLWDE